MQLPDSHPIASRQAGSNPESPAHLPASAQAGVPISRYPHLHPGAIFERIDALAPSTPHGWITVNATRDGSDTSGYSSSEMLSAEGSTALQGIIRLSGIPEVLLLGAQQAEEAGVQLHSLSIGQNIKSYPDVLDGRICWYYGAPWAVLCYMLPDKSRFVFRVGEYIPDGTPDHERPLTWPTPDRPDLSSGWAGARTVLLRGSLPEAALAVKNSQLPQ